MGKKLYDDYDSKKDIVNQNTYIYTGIKSDSLGMVLLALSVLSVYISIYFSYVALPVCALLLTFSVLQHRKNKTTSTIGAIYANVVSLLVALFILVINHYIF